MNDDDIAAVLRTLETPISPGAEVDQRIEERMIRALHATGDRSGLLRGEDSQRSPGNARVWALAAATIAVVVGGLVLVVRRTDPEPPAVGERSIPAPDPATSEPAAPRNTTSDTADDETISLPVNVLGYQPFTSAGFGLGPLDAPPETGSALERVGAVRSDGDGFVAQVRRVIGAEVSDFEVVVRTDGSAVVPVEFIDPLAVGGTCVGGRVVVSLDPPSSQTTVADCAGRQRAVAIVTGVGTEVPSNVDGDTRMLRPITYSITVDGSPDTRTLTLWHTADDLVHVDATGSPITTTPNTTTNTTTNTEESP